MGTGNGIKGQGASINIFGKNVPWNRDPHIGALNDFKEFYMYQDTEKEKVVKYGKCLYDNSVEYGVKIIECNTLYGTGDYEDPPEIRDDREIICYYVFYEDLAKKGEFNSRAGGFLSIEEAVAYVEENNVEWF